MPPKVGEEWQTSAPGPLIRLNKPREELRKREEKVREDYLRVAPGAGKEIPLRFADPDGFAKLGPGKEAAWDQSERSISMLRDALRNKPDDVILWQQLRELSRAHLNSLPPALQKSLQRLHSKEMQYKTGPLYKEGKPRFPGEELSFEDWYAERNVLENRKWAKRRRDIGAHDGSPPSLAAAYLRKLLYRGWEAHDRQFGDEQQSTFREFLDKGAAEK